jgi:hypothetical protein
VGWTVTPLDSSVFRPLECEYRWKVENDVKDVDLGSFPYTFTPTIVAQTQIVSSFGNKLFTVKSLDKGKMDIPDGHHITVEQRCSTTR